MCKGFHCHKWRSKVWINIQRWSNIMAMTWQLWVTRSFGIHKMQASQACSTKAVGGSKSTHGANSAKMERNRRRSVIMHSHLNSQEWEDVQRQMEWTQFWLQEVIRSQGDEKPHFVFGRWLRKNITNITYFANSTKNFMKQLSLFKGSISIMHRFMWKTCKQKAMAITLHWYLELTHKKTRFCRVIATFIHGRVVWWSLSIRTTCRAKTT